jgi:Tol biopolymer transport system component
MSSTTMGGRVAAPAPILVIVALAMLLVALVGLALVAGRPAPTLPAGAASNGRIVAVDGMSLVTYAPDGTDRRELLGLPSTAAPTLAVSPDGTRVAYRTTGPVGVEVVRLSDGSTTSIPVPDATAVADEYISWSPDGTSVAFAAQIRGEDELVIAAADGSSVRTLHDRLHGVVSQVWQPTYAPDGQWLAFAGSRTGVAFEQLFVVHPDGTGLQPLETEAVEAGDGGGPVWSPDRAVHRLAYETFRANALHLRVYDVDAGVDQEVGEGFWPSWSPDGSRLAGCCASIWSIDDVRAGTPARTVVFGQPQGYCPDNLDWSGRAICSPVTWSPDGRWLVGGDIAGKDLLIARSDGTGEPIRVRSTAGVTSSGFRIPLAWQPVWP